MSSKAQGGAAATGSNSRDGVVKGTRAGPAPAVTAPNLAASLSDEASVRQLVETALANDDVTSLLRLVLVPSKQHAAAATAPTASAGVGGPNSPKADSARPAEARPALLDGKPPLEVLQRCLRAVASEQEAIILDVCHSNALEIAQCVAEMDSMAASAQNLRKAMAAGGDALQRAGSALCDRSKELHNLLAAQNHLLAAVGGLHAVRRLLQRCLEVGALLESRRLFAALQLLADIRQQQLGQALAAISGATPQQLAELSQLAERGTTAVAGTGTAEGASGGASYGGFGSRRPGGPAAAKLRAFLQGLVAELDGAVEYYAFAEFNNWLVGVRSEAKRIGLRAIRKAAIERQLHEDLARERRTVAGQLMGAVPVPHVGDDGGGGGHDVAAVAASAMATPFRQQLLRERGPTPTAAAGAASSSSVTAGGPRPDGTLLDLSSLAPGQPLQAMREALASHRAAAAAAPHAAAPVGLTDWTTPLLQGLDMQGLFRCVHVHRGLGRLARLSSYYIQQRRLQVTTDLAPPQNFLEAHQAYLAQVAGFFIVESEVRSLLPDLLPPDAAALLWDVAAAGLKSVLARALEEIGHGGGATGGGAPAPIMLLLKDFVLLLCNALAGAGFATAPIVEVLLSSRGRYHDLLTVSVALRVGRALAEDSLAHVVVATEAQAAELFVKLGLPPLLEGAQAPSSGGLPALPFSAPFSACVPKILQAVRGFVSDSLAFLRGLLLSGWELLPAVVQARDKVIIKTVVDGLADHLARLLSAPGWRAREVMGLVTNLWAVGQAMEALDHWTLLQVRPLGAMAAAAAAAAASAPSASSSGGHHVAGAAGGSVSAMRSARTALRAASTHAGAGSSGNAISGGAGGDSGVGGAGGSVMGALRSLQDACERGLLRLVAGRAEQILQDGARTMNWLPAGPLPEGPSPHVADLLDLLRGVLEAAAATVPRSSYLFLARGVVRAMGHVLMRLLSSGEGVRGFNLFAIERLAADCAAIEAFAMACPAVPNLAQEFAEPSQLVALLLSPKVEDVIIPEVRRQRYPSLELATLVLILERYREQAKVGKERTGHATRRQLDAISKQLRAQMVSGTAVSGARVLEDI